MKTLYMMVTQDEYELPLCVCSSYAELACFAGVSAKSVKSAILHAKARGGNSKYKAVLIDDEDD